MPRLLQLVHGFPPTERAGTEVYAARLADGLRARGWQVHTLAATRQPGRPQYECIQSPGLTRIVQNMPFLGISQGEQDRVVERIVETEVRRFRPDFVHIQHIMFLSAGVRFPVPTFWTLHDAWGWCAAGGTLLLPSGERCAGPEPERCLGCARHRATEPALAVPAVRLAARLGAVLPASALHRLYQRVPAGWRARLPQKKHPVSLDNIADRQQSLLALARHCRALVSPSRFLAERAVAAGFPRPRVVPHGVSVPAGYQRFVGEYFLFLGTLAPHKGPLLVRQAHRAAGVGLPLRIVGPPGADMGYLAALSAEGPVEAGVGDIWPLLARAQALVLGSAWDENAPLVVLEALSAGVPVVAPRLGGLSELVGEEFLYAPGDKNDLVRVLRSITGRESGWVRPPTFEAHLDSLVAVYIHGL